MIDEVTTHDVNVRFRQAVCVLRKMEVPDHVRFSRYRALWPATGPDQEAVRRSYGYEVSAETPTKPTMDDLQLVDEVHNWCFKYLTPDMVKQAGLPRDAALLLWLRAENVVWEQIQKIRRQMYDVPLVRTTARGERKRKRRRGGGKSVIPGGNSKTSLLRLHNAALAHVTASLNRDGVKVRRRPMPVEAIEIAEPPRSLPHRIEDVVDQLGLDSVLLQQVVVLCTIAESKPGACGDLRQAKQLIDREIGRRLAAA